MIADLLSDWMGRTIVAGLALCVLAVIGLVAWGIEDSYSHRNDTCVKSHPETYYIKVGDVMVPATDQVCDQWVPKGAGQSN